MPDPASEAKRINVPSYSDILRRIKSRYPHNVNTYERERRSLDLVKDVIIGKTEPILQLRSLLRSLHPFYRELVEIDFDLNQVERDLECIMKSRAIAQRLWESYRYAMLAAESEAEARRIGREARGRMLSQLRRCSSGLARLKELVKFLSGLPGIDVGKPIVVIAGPPNAGKSTFLSSVSRAKPEVAPYPFTTKEIIVGHANVDDKEVQVVDTPGLLDRDPSEMNQVERRAVAALRELPCSVIFLMDPTDDSVMPLESQVSLLRRVMDILAGRRLIVAVNKVDVADPSRVEKFLEASKQVKADGYIRLVAKDRESAIGALRLALANKGLT